MAIDYPYFRRRLESELAQARATLAQAGVSAGTVTLDQSSVGRLSRMDALQQQAMAQGLRERVAIRVRRLEAALARLEAGRFGKCCQCGADVEPERLQAEAATVFCGRCQEERDARREEGAITDTRAVLPEVCSFRRLQPVPVFCGLAGRRRAVGSFTIE